MKMSENIDKILPLLFKVKQELGSVTKSSDNPFFKSRYADLNQHLDVVEPVLSKHGLMLLQPPGRDEKGPFVETIIFEPNSGQFISTEISLVLSKQDMQALGACVTYGRRFSINSLFSLKSEDDDGETAVGRGKNKQTEATFGKTTQTTAASTTPIRSSFRSNKANKPLVNSETALTNTVKVLDPNSDSVEGWE